MGWLWFIPTFHMPQPPPQTASEVPAPIHFKLTRKEIDFPVGIGSWIVDLDIEMQWLPLDSRAVPPARKTTQDEMQGKGSEPVSGGVLAGVGQIATGGAVESAVDTAQAARD